MSAELPNFKKFISEDDIAAAKQKRQEEWEKVRQPDQPEGWVFWSFWIAYIFNGGLKVTFITCSVYEI